MINTENQIREKAKVIMADILGKYYSEEKIENAFFTSNDQSVSLENPMDTWTVAIRSVFNNTDFLVFADETAEPIFYQNFNTIVSAVKKNAKGKYHIN